MPDRQRILVAAAVVLSGAAALVYEVVWTRQLSVFLGITLRAEAVVLAAFMIGLALGSRMLGRWADHVRRPLLLFAALEAAIGLYGLATIELLPRLAPWYGRLARPEALSTVGGDVTRFLVAAVALLVPTLLMGGTVPALVRAGIGHPRKKQPLGLVIGRVYALNILGAALGAFAAGFLLLPRWGVSGTLAFAAGSNLAIAFAAGWIGLRRDTSSTAQPAPGETQSDSVREPTPHREQPPGAAVGTLHVPTLLAAFALFGAAALVLQLGWVQALTQILGSSVYAFSLTLSGYLAGLGAGGFAFAGWMKRRSRAGLPPGANPPVRIAPWICAAAAVAVVAGLLAFDSLPAWFLQAFRWNLQSHFGWLAAFSLLTAWSLILIPTALFGFLSPLVAAACSRSATAGKDVGAAYAVNTLGAALGALAAGYWMLPSVGQQNTLLLGSIALAASAALLYLGRRPKPNWGRTKAAAAVLAFALAAASTPTWDPVLTTSGVFINASRILDSASEAGLREALSERNRILFYRESAIGSVSVREVAGDRLLVINGKADGSRVGDRRTQLALGHLPALLHADPAEVLIVGFGTGMTAAAIATHPEVERIDVVEISPQVIEASRYFAAENRGVLFDARLRLHYADARNYLLASRRSWDVLVSEPSNPWISGVANLFTREYFELAKSRLRPNGVMAQWFQGYGMSIDDLRSVIGTFGDVFEEVTIWAPQPGDLVLIGSREAHALDAERMGLMERIPGAAQDLVETGWNGSEAFVRMLLQDASAARTFAGDAPRNSDQHPRVEFNAPRNLYRETTFDNMIALVEHGGGRESVVPIAGQFDRASSRIVAVSNREQANGESSSRAPRIEVDPEVRVRWTELRAAQPTPLPTLGVSLRRLVVVRGLGPGPAPGIEIEVLDEAAELNRGQIEDRLRNFLAEPVTAWAVSNLADGTPTLRAAAGSQVGIAWSCPEAGSPGALYVAVVEPQLAGLLEAALECIADGSARAESNRER